ncbi:GNAT family N-acetyltransferase [Rhabdobacter roseus]|uniref:Putative acetyltransferase n=1 Tax=Rhabdobacter roseus TaxID=1655419 RepID=A0A840U064_9BACT|nr:GNAT family N-acetyltransferase [Rhabdobacter roseus]MBB5286933.1 putative acetyltransferase [Rhabdobacter roseus]
MTIRPIQQADNQPLADVIRAVFREFGIDRPGTVYTDPTTDRLYELFREPGSVYWVAEKDGVIMGGCGLYPTPGLPPGCAELVKFYLARSVRGQGAGRQLMQRSVESARELGYAQLYLESFPELAQAVSMYEKAGFQPLEGPLGNSGHYACTIWMLKEMEG